MANGQLERIRQYCDTTGVRLSQTEKDLLCKILDNPAQYNGFTSIIHNDPDSDKDFRGRWNSMSYWQYRINIGSILSIDKRFKHECDDGYDQTEHWDWANAWHITALREIISILREIELEL